MPKLTLSEAAIRRIVPTPKKQVAIFDQHRDGRGLVLTVNPGGSLTWSTIYYDPPGVSHYRKLGRYPILSLAEAREQARYFLANQKAILRREAEEARENAALDAMVATGTQYVRISLEAGGGPDLASVVEDFVELHVEANGLRSQREIERLFAVYVVPRWGERPIASIRRSDVAELLDQIAAKNGRRQADAVLGAIRSLFHWFELRFEEFRSPVIRGMQRGKNVQRERVLDDDELRAVWLACGDDTGFPAICKLALLTAQRRQKIAEMKWSDLVDGEWRIRSEPREKGNPGMLRLPPLALQIIGRQPRRDSSPYVFAGPISGGPFIAWTEGKDRLKAKLPPEMERWTLHDLRRTARTLMEREEARIDEKIAERLLGHTQGGVKAIYNRHRYANEMGAALQRLADLVISIVEPEPEPAAGNVVPLRATA